MLLEVKLLDIPKLKDIIERNIASCNVGDRTSFEYVKSTATLFSQAGDLAAWTDSLEDPHLILIVTKGKFGVLNETIAFINTLYIDEGYQNSSRIQEMVTTAELWAKGQGCDCITGSSWVFRGSKDISTLWENLGYQVQEKLYVKGLK